MAKIMIETNEERAYTLISNDFIDNFMPGANPVFALIYIYLIRNKNNGLDTSVIAENFSILESDVLKAFKYWDKAGLIKYEQNESGGISISLGGVLKKTKAKKAEALEAAREIIPSAKPKYNPIELEMYKNDYKEIGDLFEFCEHTLGKTLSDTELSTLYSFYDWLRLPIDVIKFLLEYCADKRHRRIKYIEAVAIDWAENKIKSVEAAKDYINIFNKDYREIMNAMGLSGRNPATKELEFMDKWYKEWTLPLELITEGCAKTVIAVGKAQFGYADKILESWYNAGAKTLDDVKNLEAAHKEKAASKETAAEAKKEMPKRKSRFTNYEQHVRDYDEIDRLEYERLKNKL
ncbi:MAG: DnaD domain protein [Defluviitaleaceae bacterium]|nr:DnaD domain protein [Defluviitaleaceae bacterium]